MSGMRLAVAISSAVVVCAAFVAWKFLPARTQRADAVVEPGGDVGYVELADVGS
jgi:hypothetical protein